MGHRIGIIGLGTVGSRFVEQFNLHDDFDLVAAWDPDPAACAVHATTTTIGTDAASVIGAADAVYIAVPPLFHRGYVEACVAAGVGIFCEKPLGIDVNESRAMTELVEASGLPAGVNFVFSTAPSAVEIGRRLEAGEIGAKIRGDLRLHFGEWPRAWHAKAQWLTRRDQGGWIREVVSHYLFLAERLLGPAALETSTVRYPDGPDGELCEVDGFARLDATGTPMLMFGTAGGAGPDELTFTVRGTTGSMRILDWYRLQTTDGTTWHDVLGSDRATSGSEAYSAQLDDLSMMLRGEPHRIATFAEALRVQELVEEILDH